MKTNCKKNKNILLPVLRSGSSLNIPRSTLIIFFIFIFLATCKSAPFIPDLFKPEAVYVPLDPGASTYIFVDMNVARSIISLMPIEELNERQTRTMLDRTDYAAIALFTPESGRRFQIAAWGSYPNLRAGFAFIFNKNWKKHRSQESGSYWHSVLDRLSIALSSTYVSIISFLNGTPSEPQASEPGIEFPAGFDDFRTGSSLSCWLEDPAPAINRMVSEADIPIQFPVTQLFINLYKVDDSSNSSTNNSDDDQESYEAVIRFFLGSNAAARGMVSILNLAAGFITPESNLKLASILFANPAVQDGRSLDVKTAVLSESEIAHLFDIFLVF